MTSFTMKKKLHNDFFVFNGITVMKSLKIVQKCFGKSTTSRSQRLEWHKVFSEDKEISYNLPNARSTSTYVNIIVIVERIKETVLENCCVGK